MKFKFEEFLEDNPNMSYDMIIDEAYTRIQELTEAEPDEEIRQYDEWLLDQLQNTISYIHSLEKKVRKGG